MANELSPEQLADLEKRKAAGKAGRLYRIEVLCKFGNEEKRHELSNQMDGELFRFRQQIFSAGIMLPVDPNRWVIIHPMDIKEITVYKQSKFFEP